MLSMVVLLGTVAALMAHQDFELFLFSSHEPGHKPRAYNWMG